MPAFRAHFSAPRRPGLLSAYRSRAGDVPGALRPRVAARPALLGLLFGTVLFAAAPAPAQPEGWEYYDPPERQSPGDEMIQSYLAQQTEMIHSRFLTGIASLADWQAADKQRREEYFYMLGLHPLPARTPLHPKVTGRLEGDGFVVEMLHFQSRPRLYVTGNLYRPPKIEEGQRLPAVLYVCGHSYQGRNGNKTAFQSHGIWFARHGYVCLIIDSLQLGEIAAIHHGTYRYERWWWHSRGYTPAGVECWNGVRAIDYLSSRPDVDPERIAVTGISGGGAASFWIAAADQRVRAAVPVSGLSDLPSYVTHRVINGHCDCMFLYNTFQWPWAQIAGLVAPRALLFTNSDHDRIFPMDGNERVINRLERIYSLYGASDRVDAVVSIGGHAYRQDLRQAAFRFINTYLKDDPRAVTDSEVDLVSGQGAEREYPIDPLRLRVFPEDSDLPADELNTQIDEHFVPLAQVAPPKPGEFEPWKGALLAELRRVTFRWFPERIPPAELLGPDDNGWLRLKTEPGIHVVIKPFAPERSAGASAGAASPPDLSPNAANGPAAGPAPGRVLLVLADPEAPEQLPDFVRAVAEPTDAVYLVQVRGVGATRWTRKNPPNYVERAHVLLGLTVAGGRIWDVIAAAGYLRQQHPDAPLFVAGEGPAAVLSAYAALWDEQIAGAVLCQPRLSHMEPDSPPLLNVLRVCDVPDVLGMIAPRPLVVSGLPAERLAKVRAIYQAAGASEKLAVRAEPSGGDRP